LERGEPGLRYRRSREVSVDKTLNEKVSKTVKSDFAGGRSISYDQMKHLRLPLFAWYEFPK
jgi:hypothetical protein